MLYAPVADVVEVKPAIATTVSLTGVPACVRTTPETLPVPAALAGEAPPRKP